MDTNGSGGRRAKRWASAVVMALILVSAVPLVAQGATVAHYTSGSSNVP